VQQNAVAIGFQRNKDHSGIAPRASFRNRQAVVRMPAWLSGPIPKAM
jgi:hypothetical protein